jgi:hypothetical protein
MTPDGEHELITLLKRIADSLERLSPESELRERKPAHLGTATYTREEREQRELREKLRGKKPDGIQGNQAG